MIYSLFLSICDTYDGSFAESDADSARIYKSAVEYMNENLEKNLSVCDIAEYCCLSTTGLKKVFTEYAGIGIHKFFLKLKIKKAATLLAGGITTSEISHLLGFSSQGYFSEAFKRETGLSPKEYRKRCSDITHY
jgi:AraC-like DNA-binding protein